MFNINDLMSEDFTQYPKEAQAYLKQFSDKLKECIKEELVRDAAGKMLAELDKNKEAFIAMIGSILENGFKGYNNMSMRSLINMYLEVRGEEEFIKLIEKAGCEL